MLLYNSERCSSSVAHDKPFSGHCVRYSECVPYPYLTKYMVNPLDVLAEHARARNDS